MSSYPKDTIYTHQWTIEDFPKAMKRNDGKIDSPIFKMPGLQVQRSFFLRITRSKCDQETDWDDYDDVCYVHEGLRPPQKSDLKFISLALGKVLDHTLQSPLGQD